MPYYQGFQESGTDFLTADIASNVDRHVSSLRDYVEDSQIYQAFLYGYAADAYRRKLFAPINGIRSWMFKSFPEKPVSGFGVIDCFDTPTMGYYAQKRTFARVALSYAIRYPLESMPAGADWKVPVWISNAGSEALSGLAVESTLYRLNGEVVNRSRKVVDIHADKAAEVLTLDWKLPEHPGLYLLRGQAMAGSSVKFSANMYVKVVPEATRKRLRVLLLGTPEWGQPVADYLSNLGAVVTPVLVEPTVIRHPAHPFPDSAAALRQNYDVIWLAGFDNYWREAPGEWSRTIAGAVRAGVTFVHTGGAASFHGIGDKTAALDLTPLAALLPVEVQHENDAIVQSHYKVGAESNGLAAPSGRHRITATEAAPQWLRDAPLDGLSPNNFHLLDARKGSAVLLRLDDTPLLVTGNFGAGKTIAYLGFSPAGSATVPAPPAIVDRAVRASPENRLFAMVCASILSLAAGEQPSTNLENMIESRATPLYETLKAMRPAAWPRVTATWTNKEAGIYKARIHIQNGGSYLFGFRLRLDGPDFQDGRALAIWSEQYFDLLPNQSTESEVEVRTSDRRLLQSVSVIGERTASPEVKIYGKSTAP
ncbi:MAG: glutamine amidotransferase, partial [Bryobacteraceae bacterium]